ncbi:MAG: DMT family transporter [Proteobacteria bacterium]|nr:DMT family transporter [Pseudomonadota bacterium]
MKKSWLPVSAVVLGILWMLAGGAAFTIMGALIKHLSQTLPITVIVFFRMLIGFALLLPWILRERLTPVVTSQPGLHVVRSITGFLSLMCLVYSLSRLDLTDAVAISFTTPLWMIIIAAVLLGEGSGPRRWLATVIGFGGVLVIVRPDMDPDPAMLAALASACLGSLSLACVKKLSRFDSALTITFYFALIGTLFSIVPAMFTWVWPTPFEYLLLVATGITGVTGLMCSARAYSLADATVISPVDFTRLPFAAVIGYVIFGETPDLWTLSGVVIIMASILYIGRRAKVRA